jgi:hypothetical protein
MFLRNFGTLVGTNLCVPRSLNLKGSLIGGMGGVEVKDAGTVRAVNFMSPSQ